MCALLNGCKVFDAWMFYAAHWGELAITALVVTNAVRGIWEEYGC